MYEMTISIDNEIRTRSCPDCYLCGTKGDLLYQGLQDRFVWRAGKVGFEAVS